MPLLAGRHKGRSRRGPCVRAEIVDVLPDVVVEAAHRTAKRLNSRVPRVFRRLVLGMIGRYRVSEIPPDRLLIAGPRVERDYILPTVVQPFPGRVNERIRDLTPRVQRE